MDLVIFATGNELKFDMANEVCASYGIKLLQKKIDIDEIQSELPNKIALDKAAKAFSKTGEPVIISDDSWAFHGLRGFPGPYMHSINEWFGVQDFLNLTRPLKDKSVTLHQTVVYKDSSKQQLFSSQIKGKLLDEARGSSPSPNQQLIILDGDNGLTIGEIFENGKYSGRKASEIWHEFAKWHKEQL